jgi:hypothetical protein
MEACADIQKQVVCEVRQKGTDCGCGLVRSGRQCRARIDRRRPWRRRHQATHRPLGRRQAGGFRTIILFRAGSRAFFVHGFAKNEQDNIRDDERAAFKMLAAQLLAYDDAALAKAMAAGVLMEVIRDDQAIS